MHTHYSSSHFVPYALKSIQISNAMIIKNLFYCDSVLLFFFFVFVYRTANIAVVSSWAHLSLIL